MVFRVQMIEKKVSFRPRGCVVSEGVQRWMIILCSLQRLYGRVWLFFCSTPHLKILSNSPQVKHLLDRWLKFTFFLHFKKNQQAYLGRKLCVTVNQQHFMVWNDEEITFKDMSKFQVFLYCLSKTKQWGHPNYFLHLTMVVIICEIKVKPA